MQEPTAQADMMNAFDAGLRAGLPVDACSGVVFKHKDYVAEDFHGKLIRDAKRSQFGPVNPAGTITVVTPEAIVALWAREGDERSCVFANPDANNITLVFDGKPQRYVEKPAGWFQYRAVLQLRESRKLAAWKKAGEWQSQTDFANFLEDNLEDVVIPTGNDLLAIATDLEANSSGSFKGRVNLANGSVALRYVSETETTVEVPAKITLGIPLFEHGDRYRLTARLRFRVTSAGVSFRVILTNLNDAIDSEFERIVQEIEEKTHTPAVRGKIETPWDGVPAV